MVGGGEEGGRGRARLYYSANVNILSTIYRGAVKIFVELSIGVLETEKRIFYTVGNLVYNLCNYQMLTHDYFSIYKLDHKKN